MAYKAISFKDTNAIGSKVSTDVLCTFPISAAGSLHMRVEVTTAASEATAIKLQHSSDGVVWSDVATSGETGTTHNVVVNAHDDTTYGAITPLKPLGRIVSNATMDTTKVLVIMDR